MPESRVLLVYPGSLFGGRWADGPRVKPELVSLFSELRRAGREVDVLDLEAELGNPGDDAAGDVTLGTRTVAALRPAHEGGVCHACGSGRCLVHHLLLTPGSRAGAANRDSS